MSDIYDYSKGIINETIVIDGVKYCYTLYPELFSEEDEQLDFTGNVFVLAITPAGTQSFTIYNDGEIDTDEMAEVDKNKFNNIPETMMKAILDDSKKIRPQ